MYEQPRFIRHGVPLAPHRTEPSKPFQWPLARFGNRDPIVLATHQDDERQGLDLGYQPSPLDHELFVPVHAANDGDLVFALDCPDGFAISLDHGGSWTTHYAHLSKMFVPQCLPRLHASRRRVKAGEVIGYAARNPLHIRFELWHWTDDRGYVPVDPLVYLEKWRATLSPAQVSSREAA